MGAKREVVAPPVAALEVAHQGRPASTVVRGGAFLFVSGLTAVDPQTGKTLPGTTASETRVILGNLKTLLEAAGSSLDKVVKVNVLLASMLEAQNMERRSMPASFPIRHRRGPSAAPGCPTASRSSSNARRWRDVMSETPMPRSVIQPNNPRLNVSRNANLPHVPGIRVGDYIFLSGMGPIDPETGERNHGPIADQVRTTLANVRHMLESSGSSLERVVRVHVVLADIADMAEMDRVYREFFPVDPPHRVVDAAAVRQRL